MTTSLFIGFISGIVFLFIVLIIVNCIHENKNKTGTKRMIANLKFDQCFVKTGDYTHIDCEGSGNYITLTNNELLALLPKAEIISIDKVSLDSPQKQWYAQCKLGGGRYFVRIYYNNGSLDFPFYNIKEADEFLEKYKNFLKCQYN